MGSTGRVGDPLGGVNSGGGRNASSRDASRAQSAQGAHDVERPPKRRRAAAIAVGLCIAVLVGAVAVSIGFLLRGGPSSGSAAVAPTSVPGEEAAVDAEGPNLEPGAPSQPTVQVQIPATSDIAESTTNAPITSAPTTSNPTEEPIANAPSSDAPTTSNPATSAPISSTPTIAPATPNPTAFPTGRPTLEPSVKPTDPPVIVASSTIVDAFTVLEQVGHDPTSFTQGLSYGDDGTIFETTGLHGHSKVRRINPTTFEVELSIDIDAQYFGEGCAFFTDADGNGRLIHITWREQTGFIYDAATLQRLRTFQYTTTPNRGNQGWGITYDTSKQEFIVSDGTSRLFFWDRDTLVEKRSVTVARFDGTEQARLNELELIDGLVCCNIWYSDHIICVDSETGKSVREYDMSELWPADERGHSENVLNGIALGQNHVLLTGKRWDRAFKVVFPDWTTLFDSAG
ncbi:hypothetical protein ACHAXT_006076 [Thalassiosira profunda]